MEEVIESSEQPLDTNIFFEPSEADPYLGYIRVGNTGMAIEIQPDSWRLHYSPESQAEPNNEASKYSLIFAHALFDFVNWWRDLDNLNSQGINGRRSIIKGVTNKRMHNFRKNLFNSNENNIYETTGHWHDEDLDSEIFSYQLHINDLLGNDAVMSRLEKLSERCVNKKYAIKKNKVLR